MAHTSLSRGEHTQTDRAFQLIKEMDLAAGCMGGGGGGGGGDFYYWLQWPTISACKTVSRIWPVFRLSILIDRHTTLECMW